MATITTTPEVRSVQSGCSNDRDISFAEAIELLSREERFMATVQAMNTLLIQKGVYTTEEMEYFYCQWAQAQIHKPKKNRPGWHSKLFSWFF